MAIQFNDNEVTVEELLAKHNGIESSDHTLAARYAPIIKFNNNEPFFPLTVGYTVFHQNAPSPSFPRQIEIASSTYPTAIKAIEYAIWWDWDIEHLYELEHVWVYIDSAGCVVGAEASWHGSYHNMAVDGNLALTGEHIILFSEPGKHAFAPLRGWLEQRANKTRKSCTRFAGAGGVWVTPLFEGIITNKTPHADRLVHTYLEKFAFEPSLEFAKKFEISAEMLIPWPALKQWIPRRVAWWINKLERTIPLGQRRVLRIAHRGASAYAPENTLLAIKKAAELGADMVELDVQNSADGVSVIIHDSNLDYSTNGYGTVQRNTLSDLKKLNTVGGGVIPTLEEAIQCCIEHDIGLYLEIKAGAVIPDVVSATHRYNIYHRTIVVSFRPDWLADVTALDPKIATSILFDSTNINVVALAKAVGAQYVHPAWERKSEQPHSLLTPEWISRVHNAGLGVICWHEERPAEITALRQMSVDGICSNKPDLLL